jgi:hypothetical protein
LLIAEHHASNDSNSTEDDCEDIQQLHEPAKKRLVETEIEKSGEEILVIGHAASSKVFRTANWAET